jgi:hypothetical protein
VVLSLCVFDQIKHTEAVTGVTVSRLGGLRPWALHWSFLGCLCRTRKFNLIGFGDFRVGRSGLEVERANGSRARPPQDVEVNHGGFDADDFYH